MAPLLLYVGQGNETREAQSVLPVPAQAVALWPSLQDQLTTTYYDTLELATCSRIISHHENSISSAAKYTILKVILLLKE